MQWRWRRWLCRTMADKEGSEMPAWRALVARITSFQFCGIPLMIATDNNSNNASFPLARRCCYGKNARSMADALFAAIAGVTAADHERISKFCRVRLWGWGSQSCGTNRDRLAMSPPSLMGLQSLGEILFICSLMGVITITYFPTTRTVGDTGNHARPRPGPGERAASGNWPPSVPPTSSA